MLTRNAARGEPAPRELSHVAEVRPSLKVYAVQSQGASAQHDTWHDGDVRSGAPVQTFTEGIATGSTYELTFETLRAELAGQRVGIVMCGG